MFNFNECWWYSLLILFVVYVDGIKLSVILAEILELSKLGDIKFFEEYGVNVEIAVTQQSHAAISAYFVNIT